MLVALLLIGELAGYVVSAEAPLGAWLPPLVAAVIVQLVLSRWHLSRGLNVGLLTILIIVVPSIVLGLLSTQSSRADVIYFLGSLIVLAASQLAISLGATGGEATARA